MIVNASDPDDFSVVTPTDKHAWTKLFAEYFVINAHCIVPQCSAHSDDMLWYVRNPSVMSFYLGGKVRFHFDRFYLSDIQNVIFSVIAFGGV